jgi:uncharacterized protein (DUF4415 family)
MHLVGSHGTGDKVRVKHLGERGERGVIEAVKGRKLVVRVAEGALITADPKDLTNFSLAARKAWKSMPNRRVGRPRGSSLSNRISVTLRIDRDLWDDFKRAEAAGIISDRTELLNQWIRQKLDRLHAVDKRAS